MKSTHRVQFAGETIMRWNGTFFLFVAALFFGHSYALAGHGALLFRLGAFSPSGESELWDLNVQAFDLDVSDFTHVMGGVALDLQLKTYLDISVGLDGYSRRVSSQYRDFIRDDGTEIQQSFKLKVLPITGGLRFLPVQKFHKFIPHVAAGIGLYYFDYQEEGEFINRSSFEIFGDAFRDRGITPGAYVGAGLEFRVSEGIDPGQGWFVFGQFRRHWATTELSGDFDTEELDLGGNELAFGVALRF
jgi:hypothetical protein